MTTENTNENQSYQAPSLEDSELSDEQLSAVAGGATPKPQTTGKNVFTPQTTKKNVFTPQTTKKFKS
ncbi:MAG: hypothetical protein RLZZ338_1214 [Cyanobacteriota bacterium]